MPRKRTQRQIGGIFDTSISYVTCHRVNPRDCPRVTRIVAARVLPSAAAHWAKARRKTRTPNSTAKRAVLASIPSSMRIADGRLELLRLVRQNLALVGEAAKEGALGLLRPPGDLFDGSALVALFEK